MSAIDATSAMPLRVRNSPVLSPGANKLSTTSYPNF